MKILWIILSAYIALAILGCLQMGVGHGSGTILVCATFPAPFFLEGIQSDQWLLWILLWGLIQWTIIGVICSRLWKRHKQKSAQRRSGASI